VLRQLPYSLCFQTAIFVNTPNKLIVHHLRALGTDVQGLLPAIAPMLPHRAEDAWDEITCYNLQSILREFFTHLFSGRVSSRRLRPCCLIWRKTHGSTCPTASPPPPSSSQAGPPRRRSGGGPTMWRPPSRACWRSGGPHVQDSRHRSRHAPPPPYTPTQSHTLAHTVSHAHTCTCTLPARAGMHARTHAGARTHMRQHGRMRMREHGHAHIHALIHIF
jgi:hypothetical protein